MFGVGGFGTMAGQVEIIGLVHILVILNDMEVYWWLSFANTVATAVEVPAGS
jgi:hypothetical protein